VAGDAGKVTVRLKRSDRVGLFANVWLFEHCSRRELDALQRAAEPLDVPAAKVLATQGEMGREFFVVVDGAAEVTRGGTRVGTLGPGSFFGEMSLLERKPRAATVTTLEPTTVLVMSARSFDDVVKTMPSVDRKMLVALSSRLRDIEARYVPDTEPLARVHSQ
jgi:CRP/FNR family transcriptional regulator, cyclic AMP receptor protein